MSESTTEILPSPATLTHAFKLSLSKDMSICTDYWESSINKSAIIGVKDTEKFLMKSSEEYTSPIGESRKCGSDLILITNNSIYIVHNSIPIRRI